MTNNKRIRYGVIGGSMGAAHMRGIRLTSNSEVVAACDVDEVVLGNVQAEFNLAEDACYLDYRDLLKHPGLDAIIVASPDFYHEEQVVGALEAGKHVLCEKPMALTVGECTRMLRAAERTGRKLMIGQVCRYAPGFKMAKNLIDHGEIGDLFFVESEYAHDYAYAPGKNNWRKDPTRPREPVLGGGCHAVDLLRWIAGDPSEVSAYANHKMLSDWPVNDTTIGILRFPQGVIGKVFVSIGVKRNYTMRSVFYGSRGTIIADNQLPYIVLFKDQIVDNTRTLFESRYPEIHDQSSAIYLPVNIESHNTTAEVNELSECILESRLVLTDGRQGASTVAVCCALVESAAKGASIQVNYDF
jgi:UDP-N-acetylglucosamine 3-dehydrogenase